MIQTQLADLTANTDAKSLIELLDAYALDPLGGSEPLSEFARENLPKALHEKPECKIIFAVDTDKAVGLCICFDAFSTFTCRPVLNIHDVYVKPEFRGLGVARSMLRHAEKVAREKGCCKMTLEVLRNNKAAKSAYRSNGFGPYYLDETFGRAEFWQKKLT